MSENNKSKNLWSGWVIVWISFAIVLIFLAILSPVLYNYYFGDKIQNTINNGTFGYTIGGLVSPFIAISGVIVTGLAFYMQLKANEIQIANFKTELDNQKETFEKQLEIQQNENRLNQFEAQFYEMLRLHKENVNEIEIELHDFTTVGVTTTPITRIIKGRDVFVYFSNELEFAFKIYKDFLNGNLQYFNFSLPYKAFFNGSKFLSDGDFKKKIKSKHYTFTSDFLRPGTMKTKFLDLDVIAKYPIFEGHENKLGHYYRHLYHTVKFVALENNFLTYPEKRKYLRMLRAQLSNYEQAMLFYNYLAYAPEWETENKFLTDYRMIHNLYEETLIQDEFFFKRYNELKDLQSSVKTYKENDFIFESQKWDFKE